MTRKQKQLVWSWVFIIALFFAMIEFHWILWVLLPFAVLVRARVDMGVAAENEGRSYLTGLVDDYKLLKVWFAICAFVCFGGAIYIIRNGINLMDLYGFKVVVIAWISFGFPLIIIGEYELFKNYESL
jgi:hypothetical protein